MKTRIEYNAYAGPRDTEVYRKRLIIMFSQLHGLSVKTYDLRTGDRSAIIEGPKTKFDKVNRLVNRLMKMSKNEREARLDRILGRKTMKRKKRKNPEKVKLFHNNEAALILHEDPEGSAVEIDISIDLGPAGVASFSDYNDGLSLAQARRIYNGIKTKAQFNKYSEKRVLARERDMEKAMKRNPRRKKGKRNPNNRVVDAIREMRAILRHTGIKGVTISLGDSSMDSDIQLKTSKGFEYEVMIGSKGYQGTWYVDGEDLQHPWRRHTWGVLQDFFALMIAEGAQQWHY